MSDLLSIADITVEDVRDVVREAVRAGLDADHLSDFIARVDWSGVDRERPPIADTLGELEAWVTAYAERDLTLAEYVGRLLSLLPEEERRTHRYPSSSPA